MNIIYHFEIGNDIKDTGVIGFKVNTVNLINSQSKYLMVVYESGKLVSVSPLKLQGITLGNSRIPISKLTPDNIEELQIIANNESVEQVLATV